MSFRNLIVVLLLQVLCLSACSIREDRDSCPCFLTLDFRNVRQKCLSWYVCEPSSEIHAGTFEDESSSGREICLPVKRGRSVMVVVASGEGFSAENGLEIGEGDDCPELWMSRDTVDTRQDEAVCRICLHKQYAIATVRLMGESSAGLKYVLAGNVCGYAPDGELRHGDFAVLFEGAVRELTARIPRQDDNSMRLNVYESSTLVRSFPIGEILARGGYDWNAPDLEDFVIALDYSTGRISLSADLWTETLRYELVL